MNFPETRETIVSISVGTGLFIILALIFGNQGQRVLALLLVLATIVFAIWSLKIWREISDLKKKAEETKYRRTEEYRENYVKNNKDELLRNGPKAGEEWIKSSGGIKGFLYKNFGGQEVLEFLKEPFTLWKLADELNNQPVEDLQEVVPAPIKIPYKSKLEINLKARIAEIKGEMELKRVIVKSEAYLMRTLEKDRRNEGRQL